MVTVESQKEHFFNHEQKIIKGELMLCLMNTMDKFITNNIQKFDGRTLADLIFNVVIMFSRENIFNVIKSSNIFSNNNHSQLLELGDLTVGTICDDIKLEVMRLIKEKITN